MITTEKRFEEDIESFLLSEKGGYTHCNDVYDPAAGLYVNTFIGFIKATQPKEWTRFENTCQSDPVKKFIVAFNNACDADGLVSVLRHGFKHRGITFRVCYFRPESHLNKTAAGLYAANICHVVRQWHYSAQNNKSVDMVLAVNGIPLFALELKNQYTGQTVDNAKQQWMYDRDPREICFQFDKRILAYFCVDHTDVFMTTRLNKGDTFFLPFNQGSNGAGNDGGKGNPANPNGYPTAYLWEKVLQKDSALDIIQKFIHRKNSKTLIFPRFHQLDVVRKLIADVRKNGTGVNYLIQHSAGSGKSNSIAWTAYRLASLHDEMNKPVFASVIIVTDRTVLDRQLQDTISSFDHTLGTVETIGEGKSSKDLRDAINGGSRIIVTTLQKFPVIYQEVENTQGKGFAVIVDEAHSSQTGSSAMKLIDIFEFSFKINQRDMLCQNASGYFYEFVPGWFNAIRVEQYKFTWSRKGKDDLVQTGSLDYGEYSSMYVQYGKEDFTGCKVCDYFPFDKDGAYNELEEEKAVAAAMCCLGAALLIIAEVYIVDSYVSYSRGRGFLSGYGYHVHTYGRSNPHYIRARDKYNEEHGHHSGGFRGGGGCACACACACAGGGRAGCSQKDTHET